MIQGPESSEIRSPAPRGETWGVVLSTLLLCVYWVFAFEARATDLSALRVAHGEVPYRDFWTMYAPGSFLVLGLVFRVLGEQLVWSNLLGVLTTAAAVGALHRLVARSSPRGPARWLSGVFAFAFIQSSYHDGFTSYPPAILCVLIAFGRMAAYAERSRRRDLVLAGLSLGIGACFKHDVAAYGGLACGVSALLTGSGSRIGRVAILGASAAIPVAVLLGWLAALGAAPDLWQDLFVFPTTHFRHVRPESFPFRPPLPAEWPGWRLDKLSRVARDLSAWAVLHVPTIVVLLGLGGAWRRRGSLTPSARALLAIAVVAYPAFWLAAHVQINTHRVTLAALALLAASIGVRSRGLLIGVCVVWSLVLAIEPVEILRGKRRDGIEPLNLPRLSGIWVTHSDAAWMRGLARAMEDAAPAEAPVLLAGARNDVLIHADGAPFWLTDRRPATRHHELHPGITDTEAVQRRMLADLDGSPRPVVVREHRFGGRALDFWRREFQSHGVPVGSEILDAWIAAHYRPGPRFGRYEVMERAP